MANQVLSQNKSAIGFFIFKLGIYTFCGILLVIKTMANLMSKAHKATNKAYRKGYDRIFGKRYTVELEDITKLDDSVRKYKQIKPLNK